jgi:hypothetical protein
VISPLLEVGQPVLVSGDPDDPPERMTVDLVQDEHVTLGVHGNRNLPNAWRELPAVHLTCLGRFSVYMIHVPVVSSDETQLVIGPPENPAAVQRRAYARVAQPVPVSCTVLDPESEQWSAFDADVRDLGGGGCSVLSDISPPNGAFLAIAFSIDDDEPFPVVGRVLPREELPTIGRPLTRIAFTLIRETDRDRIIGFVLHSLASRGRVDPRFG